jgi:ligand-binding sensor domain-containing protein
MPNQIIQFQAVPITDQTGTISVNIYALDAEGNIWLKPGGKTVGTSRWINLSDDNDATEYIA